MAGYVILLKMTAEGKQHINEMPEALEDVKEQMAEKDIRLVGTWLTMGQYDAIAIYDAPDDQALAAEILSWKWYQTETLRAFSEEEFGEILEMMSD